MSSVPSRNHTDAGVPVVVRVAAVPVIPFRAEGGDLHHAAVRDHTHGTVLFPGQHQRAAAEHRLCFLGQGGGTQVVILGRQSKKHIPDAAPYRIGSVAGLLQSGNTLPDGIR